MFKEFLPPSLAGLSIKEVEKFEALPWKHGRLEDKGLQLNNNSFLLSSGRITVDGSSLISPGQELLGLKPFLKQSRRKYSADYEHAIVYIDTKVLADFFLQHPRAMQSYVRMELNSGCETLPEWSNIPNQWAVISDQVSWESIHFAMSLAVRQSEKSNCKAIYLEFAKDGLSIFNLMNQEPPPALIQTDKPLSSLSKLINSRLVKVNESIYALNVHFLSIWKLSQEQWSTLFWKIGKYYDEIIIHLGTEKTDYIIEQSNAVFTVTSSQFHNIGSSEPEKNQICWSPVLEVRRKNSFSKEEKLILEYPFVTESLEQKEIQMPYDMNEKDEYWDWYDQNIEAFLDPVEAFIIEDYKDNFAGLVSVLNLIWGEDEKKSALRYSLKRNFLLLQGKSGIPGAIASFENSKEDFNKKCKQLVDYDVVSILKPIFPTHSLFSEKTIERYLKNLFPGVKQDLLNLCFPVLSYENKDILFLTSGSLSQNLIRSTFAHGFVELNSERTSLEENGVDYRTFAKTNHNDWIDILAHCFRMNFKRITFVNFLQPMKRESDTLPKKLSENSSGLACYKEVTGIFSHVVNIPTSNEKYLENQVDEITQKIQTYIKEPLAN